jgi:hypothetical protein
MLQGDCSQLEQATSFFAQKLAIVDKQERERC